ncbi:MAG TPA: TolC family protein [Chitinophagaceae bacterium]|nr:TolC family protein [Chitinophagaceae bacterium]
MSKVLLILLIFSCAKANGQLVSLTDFIESARTNSYASQSTNTGLQIANLSHKIFTLSGKPVVFFNGNAPVYNKDNYAVIQPDGTILFLPRSQNYSYAGFSFSQPLLFSGGSVAVSTDLYRIDNFTANNKQYNGVPVFVRLSQPIFKYNAFKWEKQIAPLRLQEAKQTYKANQEQIAYEVCRLYFVVVAAQENEKLAISNLEHADANLAIEKRRVVLGSSTEDKVMGLEIQQISIQQMLEAAKLDIRKGFAELNTYINASDTTLKKLQVPENIPQLSLDKKTIIEKAKENLPLYISSRRKIKEAEAKIDQAKKTGKQIDIQASYGLNNSATDLASIYRNPRSQQGFSIGFNLTIADWGRRKNNIALTELEKKLTETDIKLEESRLLLEIGNIVDELQALKSNIVLSVKLDTLSQKRFAVANRLFQSGRLTLLELQAAQFEKDSARKNYILALQRFWEQWYLLKARTLTEL